MEHFTFCITLPLYAMSKNSRSGNRTRERCNSSSMKSEGHTFPVHHSLCVCSHHVLCGLHTVCGVHTDCSSLAWLLGLAEAEVGFCRGLFCCSTTLLLAIVLVASSLIQEHRQLFQSESRPNTRPNDQLMAGLLNDLPKRCTSPDILMTKYYDTSSPDPA